MILSQALLAIERWGAFTFVRIISLGPYLTAYIPQSVNMVIQEKGEQPYHLLTSRTHRCS